ncbi:MAG: hypothetical protein LBL98_00245 [Ruminococcus sp.]|jgi:hypothetical protein|nr:hypothetical protein [Ruminococcus sp.]
MYKKILSILVAVAIIFSFSVSVSADKRSPNYYTDGFSASEKAVFERVREAVLACEPSVKITAVNETRAELIGRIGNALLFYDPYTWNLKNLRYTSSGNSVTIEFTYLKEYDDFVIMQGEIDTAVRGVLEDVAGQSILTKLRYIHDFVVQNSEYDLEDELSGTPYYPLLGGSAKCDGYALAFQMLCQNAGIPCVTAISYPDSEAAAEYNIGHAWNKIKVGNNWYNIDCCLDDTTLPGGVYCYDYYMLSDNEMGSIHKEWDDPFVSEPAASNTLNGFYEVKKLTASTVSGARALIRQQIDDSDMPAASVEIPDIGVMEDFIRLVKSDGVKAFGLGGESYEAYVNPERRVVHIIITD